MIPLNNSLTDEFSKIHVMETETKQLESVDKGYEILETLEKQNKKLDDLEKKLSDSTKTTQEIIPNVYKVFKNYVKNCKN